MRAAMIKAFGEPTEVLELVDVPEPTGPAAGEVLVSVEYAPVNMNAVLHAQRGGKVLLDLRRTT
jgi:NADPH:quinone reductase-like Zn-dependent oxidoreductase